MAYERIEKPDGFLYHYTRREHPEIIEVAPLILEQKNHPTMSM